jgi:hypothetical protein
MEGHKIFIHIMCHSGYMSTRQKVTWMLSFPVSPRGLVGFILRFKSFFQEDVTQWDMMESEDATVSSTCLI